MSCNCHSHNRETGTEPEVILNIKDYFGDQVTRESISIDACIAPVIQKLWENKIYTASSCCGHNTALPSIVLGDDVQNYREVRKLIQEVDERYFELSQWKRVLV